MRRSVYSHVRAVPTLAVAARTATANGATVDRALSGASGTNEWFATAMLLVHAGAMTDGTHDVTLQDSDDGTTWATVAGKFLQGAVPSLSGTSDDKVFEVGYVGHRRYLRAVATVTGATSGGTYGAVLLLGDPQFAPISRT